MRALVLLLALCVSAAAAQRLLLSDKEDGKLPDFLGGKEEIDICAEVKKCPADPGEGARHSVLGLRLGFSCFLQRHHVACIWPFHSPSHRLAVQPVTELFSH